MGTYPLMPAGFAYDMANDGTVVKAINGVGNTLIATLSSAQVAALMDLKQNATYSISTDRPTLVVMFPGPRAITGALIDQFANQVANLVISGSNDTTDGIDGTWTTLHSTAGAYGSYRTAGVVRAPWALSGTWSALRFAHSYNAISISYWASLVVFGTTAVSGVAFWDDTNDVLLDTADMDHGDLYVGAAASIKQFRIKNLSAQTANTITVNARTASTFGVLDDDTTFDIGSGYAASIVIPSLAPGAISSVISMRRATPTVLAAGTIEMATVQAIVSSWT